MNIERVVQVALLGEVPPTLRFLYVSLKDNQLKFHAVLTENATEEHLESVRRVSTEVFAACPRETSVDESIKIDGACHWKIEGAKDLMYLRFGELSDT